MFERETMIRMVKALQKGDRAAAAEIYDTFYDDTYYFLKSTVLDPDLAADLAQDTFVEVLEKISTLKDPAAFPMWIRRVAYHKAVSYFRKQKAVTAYEDEDGYSVLDTVEEDRSEFIPDQALDQEDFKATILSMLQSLPETQRSALVLHYYEERSVQEIAAIQGVSVGTVKSRLNYGRNAIKQSVESYEKKNGIKLRCIGILPILLWLFRQGALVREGAVVGKRFAGVAAASSAAKTAGVSSATVKTVRTSATTAKRARASSAAAAKATARAMVVKAVAAVAAVALLIFGAAIAISHFSEDDNKNRSKSSAGKRDDDDYDETDYDSDSDDVLDSDHDSDSDDILDSNDTSDPNDDSDSQDPSVPADPNDPELLRKNQIHWDEDFRLEQLPNVVGVYFVNTTVPQGVETMEISELQNGNVVMWKEETHEYDDLGLSDQPLYNMYITTTNGGPIAAPEDCSEMFIYEKNHNYSSSGKPTLRCIDLSNLNTSNVTNMDTMFGECTSLQALDLSGFDTSKVTNMNSMFSDCRSLQVLDISNFDTSKVTDMRSMFSFCTSLYNLDVSGFDTTNVEDMSWMFYFCKSLQALDLSGFNTSNLSHTDHMFYTCESLVSLDLSAFDTSKVTNMTSMFQDCTSLQNLNISGFDTSKVTNMTSMFQDCTSLQNLNISGFDTSNVTSMHCMFINCSSLKSLDLSHFDTSKVTDMWDMFFGCTSLKSLDLSNFDTSNVTTMQK